MRSTCLHGAAWTILKAEVQAVRDLIKGVDPRITEQVMERAQLQLQGVPGDLQPPADPPRPPGLAHNGAILQDLTKLLEGHYPTGA